MSEAVGSSPIGPAIFPERSRFFHLSELLSCRFSIKSVLAFSQGGLFCVFSAPQQTPEIQRRNVPERIRSVVANDVRLHQVTQKLNLVFDFVLAYALLPKNQSVERVFGGSVP